MLDVAPIVYMDDDERGPACVQALVLADRLGTELQIPVFLYGLLSGGRVTRAAIRKGGPTNLQRRIDAGELRPDFGPRRLHPRAGAVLVSARPPLIAFNVELAPPATLETAQRIAALIREGGPEGLPSVRAIGLTLPHREGIAQVSTNVEDYRQTNLATLVVGDRATRHDGPRRGRRRFRRGRLSTAFRTTCPSPTGATSRMRCSARRKTPPITTKVRVQQWLRQSANARPNIAATPAA